MPFAFGQEVKEHHEHLLTISHRQEAADVRARVAAASRSSLLWHEMEQTNKPTRSRHIALDMSNDLPTAHSRQPPSPVTIGHRISRRKDSIQHPKPPLTPNTSVPSSMPQAIPNPLLPSAPASPPTPAPSPTPHQRAPVWHDGDDEEEDPVLRCLPSIRPAPDRCKGEMAGIACGGVRQSLLELSTSDNQSEAEKRPIQGFTE